MWQDIGVNVKLVHIAVGGLTVDKDPGAMVRNWSIRMFYSDIRGVMDNALAGDSWAAKRGYFDPYADPRWLENYEASRFGKTVEERVAAYAKLHEVFSELAPLVPHYQPADSFATRPAAFADAIPIGAFRMTFGSRLTIRT